ncbi:FBP domain-containing protein [Actinomycetospora aeridis]|uniref:FBP domain-containing protein n=1 Tax=Actinomycetospora aeridis TaxID=3129231 RepID=A0ABU8N0P5_9PSEU
MPTTLTADVVRRAMLNCSKGDAKRMTVVDAAVGADLEQVEFVGWHDPRMPQRAYLVTLREGNTMGTYICDDLACPATTRLERKPSAGVTPELNLPVEERVAGLRVRVDGFLAAIRGREDAARTPA